MKLSDQKPKYSAMNHQRNSFIDIFLNVVYIHASGNGSRVAAMKDLVAATFDENTSQ